MTAAPAITEQLRAKGAATGGHEITLARAPMWVARALDRPVQLSLLSGPLAVYGAPFHQVAGEVLTVSEQRVVLELTTRYIVAGCPASRVVYISLGEIARVMGYAVLSGKARADARRALARIRSVTLSARIAGSSFPKVWGLIDNADPAERGGRDQGFVTLNRELANSCRAGNVTFLRLPTWDAMAAADAYAARLWCFLEAERIGGEGWQYSVFAAPPGEAPDDHAQGTAIADLLLLDWRSPRHRIVHRIQTACRVVMTHDPRYSIDIRRGRRQGMWILRARRHGLAAGRRHVYGPLPVDVYDAWRRAYPGRRPTRRQCDALVEIVRRRGAPWVVDRLRVARPDPFGALIAEDGDVATIVAEERRLDAEKAARQQATHELVTAAQQALGIEDLVAKVTRRLPYADDGQVDRGDGGSRA